MGKTDNERHLTGEIFIDVCRLSDILYGYEYFEGSADDIWAHLYEYFKGALRCMPPDDTLMQHVLRAFKQFKQSTISKSAHLF